MNRYQSIRYSIAKQEFKDQMDPTDLSRTFYVSSSGDILGFLIVRSDGKTLSYNAAENQYCYTSKDEPTMFDDIQDTGAINLPPYDYHLGPEGERVLYETHTFPDPSTTSIYESLRLLQNSAEGDQFLLALAMTNLLPTQLNETQLSIMANKAIIMYNTLHSYPLNEIIATIKSLMIDGLSGFSIGTKSYDHLNGPSITAALLAADQESFNALITYTIENKRNHIYTGPAHSNIPTSLSEAKLTSIIPYLK